jgi:WD40 repeat protein
VFETIGIFLSHSLIQVIALAATLIGGLAAIDYFREKKKSHKKSQFVGKSTAQLPNHEHSKIISLHQDWDDAPDVPVFFGRSNELNLLKKWIVHEHCKLIVILGLRGIGKTDLSLKLAKGGISKTNLLLNLTRSILLMILRLFGAGQTQFSKNLSQTHIGKTDLSFKFARGIQHQFEYVIWRRLFNAQPITEILEDIIKFLSNQQEVDLPDTVNGQIFRLLHYLKTHRCLLILDNFEAILREGDHPGQYREGYEEYGNLLKQIGEVAHQSCLLLTSREKPQGILNIAGQNQAVHFLELSGLDEEAGEKLCLQRGHFYGSNPDWKELIRLYNGNPLALELAALHIEEVFYGDLSRFLEEGKPVFGDIKDLLDWHFGRLSILEQEIMYWLAIEREPVSLLELKEDVLSFAAKEQVSTTLQWLQRRLPIEKNQFGFALQPVLIEYMTMQLIEQVSREIITGKPELIDYMTDRFVEQVSEEIKNGKPVLFKSHALLKALAKDYVRDAQSRLILKPIQDTLLDVFENKYYLEKQLKQILSTLRDKSPLKQGYVAGNILNLLSQLKIDLTGYDFSYLTIWQAYLQGINLQEVNFAHSDLAKTVFTGIFSSILSVTFSPDGHCLVIGDAHGNIYLWRTKDGKQLLTLNEHTSWVRAVVFSPDGNTLVSCSDDKTLKLWNISTGQCIKTLQGHTNWVRTVIFSYDGTTLASCSDDKTVKLWDVHTGQCFKTLTEHDKPVSSIAFSSDGRFLASCSDDKTIKLWDVHTGQCLKTLREHTLPVGSVSFSPNAHILASGSNDQTIKFWNVDTGQCIRTLYGHKNWVRLVAFSPNGHILASGSADNTIKLWNVLSGQCFKTLQGHTSRIRAIAFSPDGRILMSGSDDQTARLWDVNTGQRLKTLQGYTNRIWSVIFSPDGQTLASSSEDQGVRLWDISTGKCFKTFWGHTNWAWSVSFSPNGKTLASGGDDQIVMLWNIDTKQDKIKRCQVIPIGSEHLFSVQTAKVLQVAVKIKR